MTIELKNISHKYSDETIIDDLSFSVKSGDMACLIGSSGCGKSTLLRIIAGLEQVSSGELLIDGNIVSNKDVHIAPDKRNIGLVFQNSSLFPHLNVMENVVFGLSNLSKDEKYSIADKYLNKVGLTKFASKYPHMLSGGQQQRVSLIRSLVMHPDIMLLDEPFANLDSVLRKDLREEIIEIFSELNITSLLVTHDPAEALHMANEIYIMDKGSIVQTGTPKDLYCNPETLFVTKFFGAVNVIKSVVKNGEVDAIFSNVDVEIPENTDVNVVIRPEEVHFCSDCEECNYHVEAEVTSLRFLGYYYVVTYIISGYNTRIVGRVTGNKLPNIGDKVTIGTDNILIFEEE